MTMFFLGAACAVVVIGACWVVYDLTKPMRCQCAECQYRRSFK